MKLIARLRGWNRRDKKRAALLEAERRRRRELRDDERDEIMAEEFPSRDAVKSSLWTGLF
jgi:hypothetical protein